MCFQMARMGRYFNASVGNWPITAARFGNWKVIVGKNCEEQQTWQAWPTPGEKEVSFGLTGGWLEPGTNHARSPLLDGHDSADAQAPPCGDSGIQFSGSKGTVCCLKSCGKCGCPGGVPYHCDKNVSKTECQNGVS